MPRGACFWLFSNARSANTRQTSASTPVTGQRQRPRLGRRQGNACGSQQRAGHACQPKGDRRKQGTQRRSQQIGGVNTVAWKFAHSQRGADPQAADQKRYGQGQVIDGEENDLLWVPGDTVAVKGQIVDDSVGKTNAEREGSQPRRADVQAASRRGRRGEMLNSVPLAPKPSRARLTTRKAK